MSSGSGGGGGGEGGGADDKKPPPHSSGIKSIPKKKPVTWPWPSPVPLTVHRHSSRLAGHSAASGAVNISPFTAGAASQTTIRTARGQMPPSLSQSTHTSGTNWPGVLLYQQQQTALGLQEARRLGTIPAVAAVPGAMAALPPPIFVQLDILNWLHQVRLADEAFVTSADEDEHTPMSDVEKEETERRPAPDVIIDDPDANMEAVTLASRHSTMAMAATAAAAGSGPLHHDSSSSIKTGLPSLPSTISDWVAGDQPHVMESIELQWTQGDESRCMWNAISSATGCHYTTNLRHSVSTRDGVSRGAIVHTGVRASAWCANAASDVREWWAPADSQAPPPLSLQALIAHACLLLLEVCSASQFNSFGFHLRDPSVLGEKEAEQLINEYLAQSNMVDALMIGEREFLLLSHLTSGRLSFITCDTQQGGQIYWYHSLHLERRRRLPYHRNHLMRAFRIATANEEEPVSTDTPESLWPAGVESFEIWLHHTEYNQTDTVRRMKAQRKKRQEELQLQQQQERQRQESAPSSSDKLVCHSATSFHSSPPDASRPRPAPAGATGSGNKPVCPSESVCEIDLTRVEDGGLFRKVELPGVITEQQVKRRDKPTSAAAAAASVTRQEEVEDTNLVRNHWNLIMITLLKPIHQRYTIGIVRDVQEETLAARAKRTAWVMQAARDRERQQQEAILKREKQAEMAAEAQRQEQEQQQAARRAMWITSTPKPRGARQGGALPAAPAAASPQAQGPPAAAAAAGATAATGPLPRSSDVIQQLVRLSGMIGPPDGLSPAAHRLHQLVMSAGHDIQWQPPMIELGRGRRTQNSTQKAALVRLNKLLVDRKDFYQAPAFWLEHWGKKERDWRKVPEWARPAWRLYLAQQMDPHMPCHQHCHPDSCGSACRVMKVVMSADTTAVSDSSSSSSTSATSTTATSKLPLGNLPSPKTPCNKMCWACPNSQVEDWNLSRNQKGEIDGDRRQHGVPYMCPHHCRGEAAVECNHSCALRHDPSLGVCRSAP
jgi:hypothetical protein